MTLSVVVVQDHDNASKPGWSVIIRNSDHWVRREMFIRDFSASGREDETAEKLATTFAQQLGDFLEARVQL